MLLLLVMVAGIFSLSPMVSSLTDYVVIRSTGEIYTTKIFARSGSAGDIQAAVDAVAAAGGGSVYVPEGTFNFTSSNTEYNKLTKTNTYTAVLIPGGVNVFGAGADKTVLVQPTDPPYNVDMFYIDGTNGKSVRISGIKFDGYVSNETYNNRAIGVLRAQDFRIDHNIFEDFSNAAVTTSKNYPYGYLHRGVIDHNTFDNPYKGDAWNPALYGAYGIIVIADYKTWEPLDNILGKYGDNTIYIENNNFSRTRYAVASNGGGWYVFRYNNVSKPRPANFAGVDVHEGGLYGDGSSWPSGRGLEAYNNFIAQGETPIYMLGFRLRAGSGVVYNNTIQDASVGVQLTKFDWATNETNYVKDLYIWGNTYNNVGTQLSIVGGFYQENVHYFLYAKEGYAPYPYPHPLTLEEIP
jgi:hypothetical protein